MSATHLIRFGVMGHLGRFAAHDATCYPRASRVVIRTERGLEIGQVLNPPEPSAPTVPGAPDGAILRGMTVEDELLEARLEKMRDSAHRACQERLDALGIETPLMDVEHLFDGRTLVFHFLGALTEQIEALTSELAEVYETRAQYRSFVETLTHGCGPGCGTDEATGGGCTSCATGCAVAAMCRTR